MSDTIKQECKCCVTEDNCIDGLCLNCRTYIDNLQKQGNVTESIFSSASLVIPLAEVHHIEKNKYGIMVILKDTKWNFEHDCWENAIHVPEDIKDRFLSSWCVYRHELEIGTLKDLTK